MATSKEERAAAAIESSMKYWQHRVNHKIYADNVPMLHKKLKKLYGSAIKTIDVELNKLYISMLEAGEISANALFQANRFKTLQGKITEQIIKLGKAEEKAITNTLFKAYKGAYQKTAAEIGIKTSWTIINAAMAEQIVYANFKGANFSDRIWKNKAALQKMLEKSVTDSVVAGKSKDFAVSKIQERFGVGFNDADRIVRTEVQRVLNEGQRQTYKDSGFTQVKWLVADDDRLCDVCEGIAADNPYNIDEVPAIAHPNCRCTVIPVITPFE